MNNQIYDNKLFKDCDLFFKKFKYKKFNNTIIYLLKHDFKNYESYNNFFIGIKYQIGLYSENCNIRNIFKNKIKILNKIKKWVNKYNKIIIGCSFWDDSDAQRRYNIYKHIITKFNINFKCIEFDGYEYICLLKGENNANK